MDDYEDDAKKGAMIALLPINSDWCKITCPHLTLVYAGEAAKLSAGAFNEMAKDAAAIAMLASSVTLKVTGQQVFGDGSQDNPMVDVLSLRPSSELLAMRRQVEKYNKSTYPFAPHVTIGPSDGTNAYTEWPRYIAFNRLLVSFGGQDITFWLRQSYMSETVPG